MIFKKTLEHVENSDVFKEFKETHLEVELCAGFFILDFADSNDQRAIDYTSGEKIFTFALKDDDEVVMTEDKLIETSNHPKLTKINPDIKLEVEELKSLAGITILDEGIHHKLKKIVAVLQNHEGKTIWNLTCMLDGMDVINILIDANTESIIKFVRHNIMDFVQKR